MKKFLLLFLVSLLTVPASATVLAYEGFDTDATGSGSNYEDGLLLQGVNKARTGFTGSWNPSAGSTISSAVNSRSALGGLNYSGFASGVAGEAQPFRFSGSAAANKVLDRSVNISNATLQSNGSYYFSALVDFNGADGGGVGFETAGGRDNDFIYDGTNVTFQSAGNDGESHIFTPQSGTNLLVVEYTDVVSTSFDTDFYTEWNLWVNPNLSAGTLGTATASGDGIGFLSSGSVNGPTRLRLIMSNLSAGNSIRVDEAYFTTEASDFITAIPEPSTWMMALIFSFSLSLFRKRFA